MIGTSYEKTNIPRAIMAGGCIALGCFGYITLGGIPGAIIFALGLCVIVSLDFQLFTGKTGEVDITYVASGIRILNLPIILDLFKRTLFWNIFGVILISGLIYFGDYPEIQSKAADIIKSRLELSYFSIFMRAVGCGLIMDLIVKSFKTTRSYIPILLGIPMFILGGFLHSIAEPFYIIFGFSIDNLPGIGLYYLLVICGNFIGCRIRKLFIHNV